MRLAMATTAASNLQKSIMMKGFAQYSIPWFLLGLLTMTIEAAIDSSVMKLVAEINARGPYIGLVAPNAFELHPFLNTSIFTLDSTVDITGRRFYVGEVQGKRVLAVMTGLGMLNAGITTQLLLVYFNISGVLHYGIAGNVDDELNIGDITIPQYWAHLGLWDWEGVDLQRCTNESNCLSQAPQVVLVSRGASANIFLDNASYRSFLHNHFNVSLVDEESAGVALTCLTNNIPFIAFRALSDLAGGSDAVNEVSTFYELAATNAVILLTAFIQMLSSTMLVAV